MLGLSIVFHDPSDILSKPAPELSFYDGKLILSFPILFLNNLFEQLIVLESLLRYNSRLVLIFLMG
jgi:hypothetical protein